MIAVVKSAMEPATLARGRMLQAALCSAYDADPDSYQSGKKKMAFDEKAYNAGRIKSALSRDQHEKCCYCETKFDHAYTGDVEHYRPKGAVTSPSGRSVSGYYWLAYAWDNLFFSCAICNQTYKRDQFPLAREADRAGHHGKPLDAEVPMLIKPSGPIDPRDHIRFNLDVPVGLTENGTETIRIAGLDREKLTLRRLAHLRLMETLCDALDILQQTPEAGAKDVAAKIGGRLRDATSPKAEFSSATLDLVSARGF